MTNRGDDDRVARGPPIEEPEDAVATRRRLGAPRVVDDDVVEIPLVEEILVKKLVVREIIRVRKDEVIERREVSAKLRKEDVVAIPLHERGGEPERDEREGGPPKI